MITIVGAGPVGLVFACELARRGVPFRIIDQLPAPTDESRAVVVHARSLEMFQRIGVVDQLIASGVRTRHMDMRIPGRLLAHVDLTSVDSAFPFSVTTPQTETERVLTQRLAGLGVTVERGVKLTSFEPHDDHVRLTLAHAGGKTETTETPWLIGTDGAHSTCRHLAGTKLAGSFAGERFILGDVEADYDLAPDTMVSYFTGQGALLAFPMGGQRLRLIAELPTGSPLDLNPPLTLLQDITDQRAGGIKIRSSHWLTEFEIHHAQVPAYRLGRVFLAGDAAHVHSPAGAQGMNTGMQDSFNLAWKLAAVTAGTGGETLLDSYHTERHPIAAEVIKLTTMITQVGTLHHPLAQHLRNLVIHAASGVAPVEHALAGQTEETTLAYRDSPVVTGPRHRNRLSPGDHVPPVPGTDLAARLADPVTTGHTILTIALEATTPPPAPVAPGSRQVLVTPTAEQPPGYDVVIPDPAGEVAARFGLPHGGHVAVRPDGYAGAIASLGDDAGVRAYFQLIAG
jgi:2-polyprenyl-6-methoxyphenol hydroxylase-like FAD-dependent oxidoreductase